MKSKLLPILSLVLILCLSVLPAFGQETVLDFEDGTNPGFYKYGACSYAVTDTDAASGSYALAVTGRSAEKATGVDIRAGKFGLSIGDTASLSFKVKQTSEKSGDCIVSLTGDDGAILVTAALQPGEWTEVSTEFTFDANRNFRFTTSEALYGADLYLDDISVKVLSSVNSEGEKDWGKWSPDLPSLKDTYAGHFLFGSEMSGSEFMDVGKLKFYKNQFAILTPGNELKPDSVFDKSASRKLVAETGDETQVAVTLKSAKAFLRYCQSSGIKVHGHTLLWHNQTPADFFRLGYNSANELASREIMLGRMENYIKAVMELTEEEYPGLFMSWDVVNEAVSDSEPDMRTDVLWYKTVGPDYIEKAFEFARKYARPDVLLCYNDYSTPNPMKLKGIIKVITPLVEQGTIDCYGFQAHYDTGWPSVSMVENAIKQISALGIKLRVSEMDIKVTSKNDANFQLQAQRYKELMDLFVKYDDCFVAVQLWGGTDDTSWLSTNYPLPFSAYGKPKPAFWALVGEQE